MLRSVQVGERGELVIPEEVRAALGIEDGTILVLMKRGDELVLRREADVLEELKASWRQVTHRALERAWDEDDRVWDAIYDESST